MNNRTSFNINDLSLKISSFAVKSLIYEVSCFPSPGLISPVSTGAHKDMDYYTFIDSICTLNKYFTLFVQEGFKGNPAEDMFKNIRSMGMEAEREMFETTKGVNTHKGMLFLMGIACCSAGKAVCENRDFNEIKDIIKEMTQGITYKELSSIKNKENLSHGEELYLKYNIKGVRQEAELGFPSVFNFSLDFYNSCPYLSINDRLVHTLIGIMQFCQDTNIVYRHSPKVLSEVQDKAREIINMGGMKTEKGREMINKLCTQFSKRNISPGGSADILGLTVFFAMLQEYFSDRKRY